MFFESLTCFEDGAVAAGVLIVVTELFDERRSGGGSGGVTARSARGAPARGAHTRVRSSSSFAAPSGGGGGGGYAGALELAAREIDATYPSRVERGARRAESKHRRGRLPESGRPTASARSAGGRRATSFDRTFGWNTPSNADASRTSARKIKPTAAATSSMAGGAREKTGVRGEYPTQHDDRCVSVQHHTRPWTWRTASVGSAVTGSARWSFDCVLSSPAYGHSYESG